MEGPDCPNCGQDTQILSTDNEWNLFCKRCDVRFKTVHTVGNVFTFPAEDSGRHTIFAENAAYIAYDKDWPDPDKWVPPPVDRTKLCVTDGSSPKDESYKEIDPKTGMQKAYLTLCPDERAKGFVRPYRESYRHVGARPKHTTRPLTDEEKERYADYGYVCFEIYPESEESTATGRFWTAAKLKSGCGTTTTMGRAIAETYARDNKFYGATMCRHCCDHFPLEEFVWEGTNEIVGS